MRKLVVLMLFAALLFTIFTPPVAAQDNIDEIQNAINGAENSLNNFWYNFHDYWSNVSDEVRYQSFNDAYECRRGLLMARNELNQKQYNMSIESAYYSWFKGERASFRIFVYMTWKKIQEANATIMKTKSYIARPPEAQKTLEQAVAKYKESCLESALEVDFPGPEQVSAYIRAMPENQQKLYWDENSAASLADEAKDQALRYQEEQEKVAKLQIEERINTLKIEFVFLVLLPFSIGAILLVPSTGILYRRFRGWLKTVKITWDGSMIFQRIALSTFISGNASLTIASGALLAKIWSIRSLSASYVLQVPTTDILILAVPLGLSAFIISLATALLGEVKSRWRKKSGIVCVVFTIFGIALLVYSLIAVMPILSLSASLSE